MSKAISLTRYLLEQQQHNKLPAELRTLIEGVADACMHISQAVDKGALGGILGSAGSENVQGEEQKKLESLGIDSSEKKDLLSKRNLFMTSYKKDEF